MTKQLDQAMAQAENASRQEEGNLILTRERILKVIEATPAGSEARQKACDYLKNFVTFSGVEFDIDFEKLMGSRSDRKPEKFVLIPSDERLIEIYDEMPDLPWRNVYGTSVIFGLRNHENYFIDRTPLENGEDYINVYEHTKTGVRRAYPNYPEWIDEMNLRGARFPEEIEEFTKWYVRSPQKAADSIDPTNLGTTVRKKLNLKQYGKGFRPYSLRYAWVRRSTLDRPMNEEAAARSLGHSVEVHRRIYRQWISVEDFQRSYERFKSNPTQMAAPKRSEGARSE